MLLPGARKVLLPSLLAAWAASCALFPDEAVLPSHHEAGAAGVESVAGAGGGHDGGAPAAAGAAQGGAFFGTGGEPAGGAPEALAGAPAGGARGCADRRAVSRGSTGDTWIESAKPKIGHGNDAVLSVVLGTDERRALVSFSLPALEEGATLVRALVTLHLESNAHAALAERHLEMSQLEQAFEEAQATWENWGNGNRSWQALGGDFGAPLATVEVPAAVASGSVVFDVTSTVATLISSSQVPLPLLVREVGDPPTAPAELAFTSRQGDASKVPELLIEYCP